MTPTQNLLPFLFKKRVAISTIGSVFARFLPLARFDQSGVAHINELLVKGAHSGPIYLKGIPDRFRALPKLEQLPTHPLMETLGPRPVDDADINTQIAHFQPVTDCLKRWIFEIIQDESDPRVVFITSGRYIKRLIAVDDRIYLNALCHFVDRFRDNSDFNGGQFAADFAGAAAGDRVSGEATAQCGSDERPNAKLTIEDAITGAYDLGALESRIELNWIRVVVNSISDIVQSEVQRHAPRLQMTERRKIVQDAIADLSNDGCAIVVDRNGQPIKIEISEDRIVDAIRNRLNALALENREQYGKLETYLIRSNGDGFKFFSEDSVGSGLLELNFQPMTSTVSESCIRESLVRIGICRFKGDWMPVVVLFQAALSSFETDDLKRQFYDEVAMITPFAPNPLLTALGEGSTLPNLELFKTLYQAAREWLPTHQQCEYLEKVCAFGPESIGQVGRFFGAEIRVLVIEKMATQLVDKRPGRKASELRVYDGFLALIELTSDLSISIKRLVIRAVVPNQMGRDQIGFFGRFQEAIVEEMKAALTAMNEPRSNRRSLLGYYTQLYYALNLENRSTWPTPESLTSFPVVPSVARRLFRRLSTNSILGPGNTGPGTVPRHTPMGIDDRRGSIQDRYGLILTGNLNRRSLLRAEGFYSGHYVAVRNLFEDGFASFLNGTMTAEQLAESIDYPPTLFLVYLARRILEMEQHLATQFHRAFKSLLHEESAGQFYVLAVVCSLIYPRHWGASRWQLDSQMLYDRVNQYFGTSTGRDASIDRLQLVPFLQSILAQTVTCLLTGDRTPHFNKATRVQVFRRANHLIPQQSDPAFDSVSAEIRTRFTEYLPVESVSV